MKLATKAEREQLETCREHIHARMTVEGRAQTPDAILDAACDQMRAVHKTKDFSTCTEDALLVIILEALSKKDPDMGDQSLANEVVRRVGPIDDFKCDRNRVYRTRRRYELVKPPTEKIDAASADHTIFDTSGLSKDKPAYAVRKAIQGRIEIFAARPGQLVIIQGPRGFGKTELLTRYLAACASAKKQVTLVDLANLGEDIPKQKEGFFSFFAEELRRTVAAETKPYTISSSVDMTRFVEDEILPRLQAPWVIAIDNSDYIAPHEAYRDDFFSMLRTWHSLRSHPDKKWRYVDIILVISIEPYMLIRDPSRSPFTAGEMVRLEPFTEEEVLSLAKIYLNHLKEKQKYASTDDAETLGNQIKEIADDNIDWLFENFSGHPMLTQDAFRYIVHQGKTFEDLKRDIYNIHGPIGQRLGVLMRWLVAEKHQALQKAYQDIITDSGQEPDVSELFHLMNQGLVRLDNENRLVPASAIHRSFYLNQFGKNK